MQNVLHWELLSQRPLVASFIQVRGFKVTRRTPAQCILRRVKQSSVHASTEAPTDPSPWYTNPYRLEIQDDDVYYAIAY